jgi:prephenate dehydrogenase
VSAGGGVTTTGETSPFARVGVIGCGLIGGSLALAAGGLPGVEEVVVADADRDVLDAAERLGLAVADEPAAVAERCDLVILAAPVAAIPALARDVAERVANLPVITDVGSTKAQLVREVEVALSSGESGGGGGEAAEDQGKQTDDLWLPYVGGHPMTGSEREGLEAADGTLFQGATYVLTPTPRSDPEALRRLSAFLRRLGSRVLVIDPDTHDRLVAMVSHLPQVLASALVGSAGRAAESDPGMLAVAGTAFRDVARVAGSNPDLWVGILRENRAAVLDAIDAFGAGLDRLRAALEAGDWDAVGSALTEARDVRERLPTKEVAVELIDLVIPVADRPGSLAEVTTALGVAGINIEDLSMRHAEREEVGALIVTVAAGDDADRAVTTLAARGIPAHLEPR